MKYLKPPMLSMNFSENKIGMKKRISNVLYNGKKHNGKLVLCMIALCSVIIGFFVGCSPKENVIKNNEDGVNEVINMENMTLDEMVSYALLTKNDGRYAVGECKAEGHIILGSEEKDNETYVYAITMYGEYGFQDDNFVKVSGSGAIPAVIIFSENEQGEKTNTIKWPLDGSAYVTSIKELFPEEYHNRVLSITKEDNEELRSQETIYAQKYLTKIGREATIGQFGDFEHPLLTPLGVSVQVYNKLAGKDYANYPYWIGTQERIEDGVRYVYEMNYTKDSNPIVLEKYNYDTREVVEKIRINSLNGEEIVLKKSLTPTGFAGSSFNRIELYSCGDVYWIQYDGAGFEYENIVKDTLIATNATDIEMFEDEGINVIGNNVKSVEVLNLGWLKFNN